MTTGHSLGGALSSLAAASLKGNFPSMHVTMYTYGVHTTTFRSMYQRFMTDALGQPRTGNPTYAFWINQQFGVSGVILIL